MFCVILVLCFFTVGHVAQGRITSTCDRAQPQGSPINIVPSESHYEPRLRVSPKFSPSATNYVVHNDGRTVSVRTTTAVYVTGTALNGTFTMDSIHWHMDDTPAHKHTFQSRGSPLEAQIIMWNSKYSSLNKAANYADGVAVFAIKYEVSGSNPILSHIATVFKAIKFANASATIPAFHVQKMLPRKADSFFRYTGFSADCKWFAMWTVFYEPQYVSNEQLRELHRIYAYYSKSSASAAKPPSSKTKVYRSVENLPGLAPNLSAEAKGLFYLLFVSLASPYLYQF